MSPLFTFLLALALLSILAVPVCRAQSLYSLCYTLSSSLSSSPVFPWSVSVSGTLNVSAPLAGSGGQVLVAVQSATLQRTAVYRGQTYSAAGLTNSLAPANSYQNNDNTLSLTAPFLTDPHSIAFVFASIVYSAYGNSSGNMVALYNDSMYGLAEDNVPPNDGVLANIQTTFTLTPTSTYTANVACTQPAAATPTATQLAALNTPVVYAFCYSFSGGPGDGTVGSTWSISVQGNITTSQYTGSGADGSIGSIVTGIQGVRVYSDPNGVITTSRIIGLTSSNWQHGVYASNVLYASYPYFDTEGLFYVADAPLLNVEVSASSPTLTVGQLVVDSYNMFDETTYDTATDASYLTSVGAIDITPAVGGNLSTLQCASNAGSMANYAFCYTLTSDSMSATPFSIVVYGVVQASGPVIRQGLPALTMQTMTGIRALTMNGSTTTQNIVRLVYINGDNDLTNAAILNDNLLYPDNGYQSAPIDYFGFVYALSSNAVFPRQTSPTTDINLSTGDGVWYEWPVLGGRGAETTVATFNFIAVNYPTSFPCQSSSAASPVVVHPSTSIQFCYTAQSAQWSIIAQGTLMLYGATITVGQRIAHALQSANGTRTYYGADGTVNTVAITGASADAFGAVNYTTYNQLLYTTAPYVDSAGLLLTLASSPLALTPGGPISGDPVVNLMALANGSLVEQAVEAGVGAANRTVIMLVLGSAAASCSVGTFGAGGGGGGGSGLSHGAIAGIVIGSVVGAVLLAALAVFIIGTATRSNKPAAASAVPASPQPASSYNHQRDVSSKATGVELA